MKIACIQINSGADMAANIERVRQLVADAAHKGAQLLALPENVFLMEEPGAKRMLYAQEEHPGVKAACEIALKHKIWLLVGSVAIKNDDSGKTYNRCLLFNPEGKLVTHYNKIHLFDVELPSGEKYSESARFLAGDNAQTVTLGGGVTLGLTICYDVRFPQLYRLLAKAGANVLCVPAAFTQTTGEAHWHVLLRARAIENGCYVIAPAQTGTHPGNRKTYGHALIIDPWGKVLADAGVEEGVIVCDIDMSEVEKVRGQLPSLQHDREFR